MAEDILARHDERMEGEALLEPVMRNGRRTAPLPGLASARDRAAGNLALLPEPLRRLETGPAYPVRVSPALEALAAEVDRVCG